MLGLVSGFLCAAAFAGGPSVLVLGVDTDNTITEGLESTGLFGNVTYYRDFDNTPVLADLSGYSAILAFTNYIPADPVGLGNVLQQYVDHGGGLVLNTYALSNPWAVSGGITRPGYEFPGLLP